MGPYKNAGQDVTLLLLLLLLLLLELGPLIRRLGRDPGRHRHEAIREDRHIGKGDHHGGCKLACSLSAKHATRRGNVAVVAADGHADMALGRDHMVRWIEAPQARPGRYASAHTCVAPSVDRSLPWLAERYPLTYRQGMPTIRAKADHDVREVLAHTRPSTAKPPSGSRTRSEPATET